MKRTIATLCTVSAVGAALAVAAGLHHRRSASEIDAIRRSVPAAAALFATDRQFSKTTDGAVSSPSAAPVASGVQAPGLEYTAPAVASGSFAVGRSGHGTAGGISLVGAASVTATLERGVPVYRGAYPGVDVVAVPSADHLEVLYFSERIPSAVFALKLPMLAGESLRIEPTTGAALLADPKGAARLRVTRPVAIDAAGTRRAGSFVAEGAELRIAINYDGLIPPVVVDPSITLPAWSILSDARGPGSATYDVTRLSEETHIVQDTTRNVVVAVRPVRSAQLTDILSTPGNLMFDGLNAGGIGGSAGVGSRMDWLASLADGGLPPAAASTADSEWKRTVLVGSETWEWTNGVWKLNQGATLPGLYDPSLAYDSVRQRTVLYGGVQTFMTCDNSTCQLAGLTEAPSSGRTFEYDGANWKATSVNAPPARVRGMLAFFPPTGQTILFGGRAINTSWTYSYPTALGFIPAGGGVPFPESATGALLNDTWAYDGSMWRPVATSSPPPAREGAQVVYDPTRQVLVLLGGHRDADMGSTTDTFTIWEFDGNDWVSRIDVADSRLSPTLATRWGASLFWNPVRGRVTIFGGHSSMLDACKMASSAIATALTSAQGNPSAWNQLAATGCLGGDVHDFWEWDGQQLSQVGSVSFGGAVTGEPVFEQSTGSAAWSAMGLAPDAGSAVALGQLSGTAPLLPWRFDSRPNHFTPRSSLERAFYAAAPDAGVIAARAIELPSAALGAAGTGSSPLTAPRMHSAITFDPTRGVATLFPPDNGDVLETNGAVWTDRTAGASPFAAGKNDFFAATWDPSNQRIVAFDPTTGLTFVNTDAAGWASIAVTASPPVWPLAPFVRQIRDITNPAMFAQAPQIAFDETRGRAVMLYQGAVWEFTGTTWSSSPLPASWTSSPCVAATQVAFDRVRARTVAFGCTVPGQTWEWDGARWYGPGPGPNQGLVDRYYAGEADSNCAGGGHCFGNPDGGNSVDSGVSQALTAAFGGTLPGTSTAAPLAPEWKATVQTAWAHANAVFYSPSLHGVSMMDGDGTLRTWNGSTWSALPTGPSPLGYLCKSSQSDGTYGGKVGSPVPLVPDYRNELQYDNLQTCIFPPVVEDTASGGLLAFRDGPWAMERMATSSLAPDAGGTWLDVPWSTVSATPAGLNVGYIPDLLVNPHPFELVAPERVWLGMSYDPATIQFGSAVATLNLPDAGPGAPTLAQLETAYTGTTIDMFNVFWSFRVFVDPTSHRIRLLTDRGMVWEMTNQTLDGLGGTCASENHCGAGWCSSEHVCCDNAACGTGTLGCATCAGPNAGTCTAVAAGLPPATQGYCGAGSCAGTCNGQLACAFPAGQVCGVSESCSNGILSATAGTCATNGATCNLAPTALSAGVPACPIVNGVMVANGQCATVPEPCPGGLGCAVGGQGCNTACTSRLACGSTGLTCNASASACVPDTATQAANAVGVSAPTGWTPQPLPTAAQTIATFADAGIAVNDAGLLYVSFAGGLNVAYDPSVQTPATSMRACFQMIRQCIGTSGQWDGCFAAPPRCVTSTPWLGDPAGTGCCPESCLTQYFTARNTMDGVSAMQTLFKSGCFGISGSSDTVTDGGT